jgi:phosphoglycolate phosphatase
MSELAIFDLDGTLLNTVEDIGEATNYALEKSGNFPLHKMDEYYNMTGNGIYRLFEKALPDDERNAAMIDKMASYFLAYYDEHMCDNTRPYPGVEEMMHRITAAGVKVAVASNKYQAGCEKIIDKFFGDIDFVKICGQRKGKPMKPDPEVVGEILRAAGATKEKTVYSGDTNVDMKTGKNAGVRTVGALWGFRTRAELEAEGPWKLAETPEELGDYILENP